LKKRKEVKRMRRFYNPMVRIYIVGRWSKRILWKSIYLPLNQAAKLADMYRKDTPTEFIVSVDY